MHPPTVGDHREGAPSRAPSLCKEPAGPGCQSFPLHVVLLRLLPSEVVKGEHFVLPDLLKSLPGGSTQAEPLVRPDCQPLVVYKPKLAPQAATKKKKKSGPAKDWRGLWTRRIR